MVCFRDWETNLGRKSGESAEREPLGHQAGPKIPFLKEQKYEIVKLSISINEK